MDYPHCSRLAALLLTSITVSVPKNLPAQEERPPLATRLLEAADHPASSDPSVLAQLQDGLPPLPTEAPFLTPGVTLALGATVAGAAFLCAPRAQQQTRFVPLGIAAASSLTPVIASAVGALGTGVLLLWLRHQVRSFLHHDCHQQNKRLRKDLEDKTEELYKRLKTERDERRAQIAQDVQLLNETFAQLCADQAEEHQGLLGKLRELQAVITATREHNRDLAAHLHEVTQATVRVLQPSRQREGGS